MGAPARALRLCVTGAALAIAALPFARTPLQMGAVLVVGAAFGGGVVPLVDSATVELTRGDYARTRLWGSLGFVVTAQALGLLLAARGDRPADPAMPLSYLACVAGYALLAQGIAKGHEVRVDRPHWREALALLRSGPLLVLLLACAIHWGACAPYHLLYGVLVRDRGLSSSLTGAGMALGVLAEVGALSVFPALLKRAGLRALFAAAFAGSALRWLLVARAESAAAIVLLQLFHGLTFGVFWGCAIEAMSRRVPSRLRATGQAIFSAAVFAAGNALGYALAGRGYDAYGSAAPLYSWAAGAELVPLLLVPWL